MSTTCITILKLAGRLGRVIDQLFQHWIGITKDSPLIEGLFLNVQIQGKSVPEKILSLSHILKNHCDYASVIWLQQFVDSWTIAPCLHAIDDFRIISNHVKVIRSDSVDALLLTAPDRIVARCLKESIIKSRTQKGYPSERRFFLCQMRCCAISWQPFLESHKIDTIKLIVFHALGPSRLDRDVIQLSESMPDWFQYDHKDKDKDR